MKKQLLVIAMLVSVVSFAYAQPGMRPQGGPGGNGPQENGNRMDRMAEKLELTDEQKNQFENLMVAHHKQVQPLKNELQEKRASLKTQVSSDNPDKKKIENIIDDIGEIETSLLKAKTNNQIAIRAMLDDKQKMMFDMAKERRKKGKGGDAPGPKRKG
ncbi:MAG: periplasmic heavy metal sensor [Cyclobacteriaceae bacterium]